MAEVFPAAAREGWAALLELVLLSMIWFLFVVVGGWATVGAVVGMVRGRAAPGAALLALLFTSALVGPATVGLHHAVDAIWSGEAIGPFDALRNFGRGAVRRYLRSLALGALWWLVLVGAFANLYEGPHLFPVYLLGGVRILLAYLLLFFCMVNVYLVPLLATTPLPLGPAIRLATWEAVANPMFTLAMLAVPAAVVVLSLAIKPLFPMLGGGALALFSTAALRWAPLRHPELPAPVWLDRPSEDGEDAEGGGGG
jgi:uncharacterized membrane protein YesL